MGNKGKSLESLIENLKDPKEAKEFRFKIDAEDFKSYGEKVISDLEKYASEKENWTVADDNREGVRIYFDKDNGDGWLLLRLSVHDPIMPLNIESDKESGVKTIAKQFVSFIEKYEELETENIKQFIEW